MRPLCSKNKINITCLVPKIAQFNNFVFGRTSAFFFHHSFYRCPPAESFRVRAPQYVHVHVVGEISNFGSAKYIILFCFLSPKV